MRAFVLFVIGVLVSAVVALAAGPAQFAGDWTGAVDIRGMKLPMVVHLSESGGTWSGSMDSPDQGAYGIAFSSVTVDGAKLHFEVREINGEYEGTLGDDGTIIGTWSQNGMSLRLNLTRGDVSSIPGRNRPQEPKIPSPYPAQDVTYPGPGTVTLAGTLTLPVGKSPFPAVVLVSGSGPQDRDESAFGHRPFLVLSDYLTRAGIAVLRVDDRGVGKSTGTFATATTGDFTDDALASLAYLKSRPEIDTQRMGIVGHSEGGVVAPMAAVRSQDVAFVVMMAGVAVRPEDLSVRQASQMMKASGASDAFIAANSAAVHRMCAIVRAEKDPRRARAQLEMAADSLIASLTAIDPIAGASSSQTVRQSIDMVNSPWFRYWVCLDPEETLRQVRVPLLAINGALDLQVDPKQNLPIIEKALREGGNREVTTMEMAGLNHMFQTAETGLVQEYATIEETMSPVAMKTVADWILARTRVEKK